MVDWAISLQSINKSIPCPWLWLQYMLKEGFKIPRSIQANTWPAVLRGRHVIGITPPHSGKTTAYLPALVTELLKTSQYLKLPKGCGVGRYSNSVLTSSFLKIKKQIIHFWEIRAGLPT